MAALDAVNNRHGRGALVLAAVGFKKEWSTKFEMCSPRYATNWDELPEVRYGVVSGQSALKRDRAKAAI